MTCPQVIKVVTPGPPGPAGPTGPAGVGAAWQQGEGAPGSGVGSNGDFYLDTETGDIYGPKTAGAWGSSIFNIAEGQQGPAGADGADGADGAAGADGSDGREVEFQASGTHIQWRYVGESSWINLVALSTITGPAGADGVDGQDGAPGAAGPDGDDGREVELQTSATHVQWRYVGEATWTDLVALSVITGPAGADGADGADGAQGPAGADGADGADAAYSDATPQPLGTAAAGTAASASRADHVHALPPLVSTSSAGLAPATGTPSGKYLKDDGTWATVEAGASPAGTGSELQFRSSSTAFGAVTGSSVDASGNITISTRWISSLNGAASAPPLALTGTWFTGGTGTTTKPMLLVEPAGTTSTAWSTSGTGLGVNAPSGFAGNLLDLQVNGSRVARLSSTQLSVPAGNFGTPGLNFGTANSGISGTGGNLSLIEGGVLALNVSNAVKEVRFPSDYGFGWASTADNFSAIDAGIRRDAAGVVAQRNGTNAQTLRVYDTFTSATDFHRIAIVTARATLSAVSGASVTATGLIPAGAVVMGVTSKVTSALGTANETTGYRIGTSTDDDRWGAITGTAAGTTSDNRNWTAGTIECFPAATDVIVTATGGNFNGTGVIYLSVQYMIGQAD